MYPFLEETDSALPWRLDFKVKNPNNYSLLSWTVPELRVLDDKSLPRPGAGIPSAILRCMNHFASFLGDVKGSPFLAGGSLTRFFLGKSIGDLDLFFPNVDDFWVTKEHISREFSVVRSKETENSLKLVVLPPGDLKGVASPVDAMFTIDLVKLFFPDPYAVLASFDFTVCCAAFKIEPELEFFCHPKYFEHLHKRELHLNNIDAPAHLDYRLKKYKERGFFSCRRGGAGGVVDIGRSARAAKTLLWASVGYFYLFEVLKGSGVLIML